MKNSNGHRRDTAGGEIVHSRLLLASQSPATATRSGRLERQALTGRVQDAVARTSGTPTCACDASLIS